ncbi:succinate dehydrogenase/fumarate reductase iron-sulfur subunit [Sulfurimonas sp. MAG313]|nr:2Fe-2S iron-sulfur cluster-binding protein [Sulfurimonas sp. MAG313]MDF1881614.1 succinate dehydrogenase/fumarate reductase iron-sulfur subunit [Sulfurimonas sp. MAG313]
MKIKVQRHNTETQVSDIIEYEVDLVNPTLLEGLNYIKTQDDSSLSYTAGCRSGVCGSCAMRVNGTEELACAYKLSDDDLIEPLKNLPVLRDLIVDTNKMMQYNLMAKAWSSDNNENISVSQEQSESNELQSDCILCGACFSACPVYEVNDAFIGPFALTRSWKYVADVREQDTQEKIEVIQTNGIWDCTLCNECVPVCPQGIAPKQDISMLRGKAGIMGFMDPNFSTSFGGGFGSPSFDGSPNFNSF